MLTLKVGTAKISQKLTTLSISWLNNEFVAASIHRGVLGETWQATFTPESMPDIASLVREAVQKTNYHGTTVSLLLANPRLAQKLVDVPPVSGSGLVKIIQREAQQQKFFNDEAAWTFQSSLTVKGVQRVILHLLPKTLLDSLIQASEKNGQLLTSVVPVSAVLHQQLTRLPINKDDVALLAAETGGFTTVVVGRADGQLLLVRTLLGDWNKNMDRMMVDLKRTIAFITQQFDLSINAGVWLFGQGAEQQAPVLQLLLAQPVSVSPVEYKPDYWTIQAAKLSHETTPNFIAAELQEAPRRRIFGRVVAVCTALLVLGSVAVAVGLHALAQQATAHLDTLRKRAGQLQAQCHDLEQRNTDLAGKDQFIKQIVQGRQPPVPAWFAGYLSEALPAELVVTNLQVKWDDHRWKLYLAGTLQATGKSPAPTTFSNAVVVLADRLTADPFHLTILRRSDLEPPTPEKTSVLHTWFSKASAPVPVENQFWIEGEMR